MHGIVVDSKGAVYAADTTGGATEIHAAHRFLFAANHHNGRKG
jgi:hypothetical protein